MDRAHRSHRKGLKDRAASLLGKHPYRCHECGYRFLHFDQAAAEEHGQPTSTEREIRMTRSAARRKQRRRELWLFGVALLLFLAFLYYITRVRPAAEGGGPVGRMSTPRKTMNPAILVLPAVRRYANEIRTALESGGVWNRTLKTVSLSDDRLSPSAKARLSPKADMRQRSPDPGAIPDVKYRTVNS